MSEQSAVRKRLMGEDWDFLRKRLKAKVQRQINRYLARGAWSGGLPEGYNADAIAAEVVKTVFAQAGALPEDYTAKELQGSMERQGYNLTHTLFYRKERVVTRSEYDYGLEDEEGKPRSALEEVVDPGPSPAEEVMEAEDEAWGEKQKQEFERLLESEPELLAVWRCCRAGVGKREQIAERLGISIQEVKNRRERLERRAAEFQRRLKQGAEG